MVEIVKLRKGFCEEADLSFSEIAFSSDQSEYWVIALNAGEIEFYLRSASPLHSLAENMGLTEDWDFEVIENGTDEENVGIITLSLEEMIGTLQSGDLEHYECWRDDGGEGLSEMSESEFANSFLIAFHFNALIDEQTAEALNEQIVCYCALVNESLDSLAEGLELR